MAVSLEEFMVGKIYKNVINLKSNRALKSFTSNMQIQKVIDNVWLIV